MYPGVLCVFDTDVAESLDLCLQLVINSLSAIPNRLSTIPQLLLQCLESVKKWDQILNNPVLVLKHGSMFISF